MTTLIKKQTVIPVTELEQSAFCQAEGNLRTKTLKEEFLTGVRWQKVPKRYLTLEPSEIDEGILYCKKQLGESVVILGHHYQRDEVIKHADITGDSFKLSKIASEYDRSKWIVFCGVHFMAETADILTASDQNKTEISRLFLLVSIFLNISNCVSNAPIFKILNLMSLVV